jgi:hypothetical protein
MLGGADALVARAVAEIEPHRLRGYGPLTEEDENTMQRVLAALSVELRHLENDLG